MGRGEPIIFLKSLKEKRKKKEKCRPPVTYTTNVDTNFVMDLENALDPDDLNELRFSFVGKTL